MLDCESLRKDLCPRRFQSCRQGTPLNQNLRCLLASPDVPGAARFPIQMPNCREWIAIFAPFAGRIRPRHSQIRGATARAVQTARVAFVPSRKRPRKPHSSRIRIDGSMESARRAGIAEAARPSSAIVNTLPASTIGSPELA
jgi:hypothetical protein